MLLLLLLLLLLRLRLGWPEHRRRPGCRAATAVTEVDTWPDGAW